MRAHLGSNEVKLYHVSAKDGLDVLEPRKPRFSSFFGLFLTPHEYITYWQNVLAKDGPFPRYIYEVDVPDDITIYIDEPNERPARWALAEYAWDRISGPHRHMWVKVGLSATRYLQAAGEE